MREKTRGPKGFGKCGLGSCLPCGYGDGCVASVVSRASFRRRPGRQMGRVAVEVASVPNSPAPPVVDGVGPTAPPPLSVQSPSSPSLSAQHPPPDPPFEKNCVISHEPNCLGLPEEFRALPYDELHQLCRRRGRAKEALKAALKTRPSTTVLFGHKRAHDTSDDTPVRREASFRLCDVHEGSKKARQSRDPRLSKIWGASRRART